MAQDGSVSSSRDEVSNYGPKNMFVNDGSFLERFRKQMEAMEKKSSAKDDGNAKQGTTKDKGTESSDKQGEQNTNQNPEKTSASRLLQVWLNRILRCLPKPTSSAAKNYEICGLRWNVIFNNRFLSFVKGSFRAISVTGFV